MAAIRWPCSCPVARGQQLATVERAFNVRFGSKAEMCAAKSHVRFTPESGHWHSHACFEPEADATSDDQTALKKSLLWVQAAKNVPA